MIGIQETALYLPNNTLDLSERGQHFGVTSEFLEKKTGVTKLTIKSETQDTSDLSVEAFIKLQEKSGFSKETIECLVVCTQNPDARGLPHVSALVHGKLGLSNKCACFDISLGCSGYVYSLSVVQAFMQVNGYKNGVLITADPYSKIVDINDKNTSLLFGDGAAATLLSDTPRWRIGDPEFGSDGSQAMEINVDPDTGKLIMNGRAVFTFTAKVIPMVIKNTLAKNGMSLENVDKYILHQGSRYIVDTIANRLGLENERVPFCAQEYGNLVSSSIPAILSDNVTIDDNSLLIAGFGVGLSWAANILERI